MILAAVVAAFGIFLFSDREDGARKPSLRSFESYRADFRKADGALPNDSELLSQLVAKGIPFAPSTNCGGNNGDCERGEANEQFATQIHFVPGLLTAQDQQNISTQFASIMASNEKTTFSVFPGIRLEKAEVTAERKLRMHFDRGFLKLASDEGALTEFSEGFAELAASGLTGTEIFIEGKRLGEYLHQLDVERDREALKTQPPTGSTH